MGSEYSSTTSQRDEMLRATQQANQTTDRLKHGRQQLLETEVIQTLFFFVFLLLYFLMIFGWDMLGTR